MDTGRQEDINELHRQLVRERDPKMRSRLMQTINVIRNETGLIRSMREALVKAHRNRDKEEIKDIHDYITGKQRYRQ